MKTPSISRAGLVPGVAFLAMAFGAAAASGAEKWSLAVKGGVSVSSDGDFHQGPAFDGSVLLGLEAGSLPVDVDVKDFDDVYGTFTEYALEAAYAFNEKTSLLLGISTLQADASALRVGTVAGTLPLLARFGDYDDVGAYVGVRYQFTTESAWTPYVSAQIGLKDVDSIDASFYVPDVTFVAPYQAALTNAAFYSGGTGLAGGVGVGLTYQANDSWQLGVESGYSAQGSLDDDDSIVGLLGLNGLNDEGKLGFLPLKVFANYRF